MPNRILTLEEAASEIISSTPLYKAAPDILAALKVYVAEDIRRNDCNLEIFEAAKAAIAKAEETVTA